MVFGIALFVLNANAVTGIARQSGTGTLGPARLTAFPRLSQTSSSSDSTAIVLFKCIIITVLIWTDFRRIGYISFGHWPLSIVPFSWLSGVLRLDQAVEIFDCCEFIFPSFGSGIQTIRFFRTRQQAATTISINYGSYQNLSTQ